MKDHSPEATKRIPALVGPTSSGKTRILLDLSMRYPIEVVSADSVQVYRRMEKGTGIPSEDELALFPHHLIKIREPDETYSAALFLEDATRAVGEIIERGRIPVIAGGTGLYLSALTKGLFPSPPPDPDLRKELDGMEGIEILSRIESLDPAAAGEMAGAPKRRLVRALEAVMMTGQTLDELRGKTRPAPFGLDLLVIEVDREDLYRRIEKRVDAFFDSGLIEETAALREAGYGPDLPSQTALGYRRCHEYLSGLISEGEARELTKRDTRRYAKRQATWFRTQVPPDSKRGAPEEAARDLENLLARFKPAR